MHRLATIHNVTDRRLTDRRTDRQTDRQTQHCSIGLSATVSTVG